MRTPLRSIAGQVRAHVASLLLSALIPTAAPAALSAQGAPASLATERVFYRNAQDSTYLNATLTLPRGGGPHPGIVLLSIAGTDALIARLAGLGYAVLLPVRRGFVEVEPLLQATYQDLGEDAVAAVEYLRARPDVDDRAIGLIGQGDDAPAAMLAAAAMAGAVPTVLLAPPGFPGREVFRLEQRELARVDGRRPQELDALDRFVGQIADVVLGESTSFRREFRLESLMSTATVRLPYNAAFPSDERQVHFFASPLWYDRLAFDPVAALGRLHAPVLVLIGNEDANTPLLPYLTNVRTGLAAARTDDTTVCLIPGRIRHTFTTEGIEAVVGWLGERVGTGAAARPTALPGCLPDPPGG